MRKPTLILLATLLCLNLGVPSALADGMILPLDLNTGYLGVRSHHVAVTIEDSHATTRVEQEFHNPHPFPVDGRYLFPVPPDAIMSHFQATVDGQTQPLTRQDAAATNETLYTVLAQQHDPSLLQYVDWESIAFDISLSPGESRRMVLEYEQVLAPAGGLYRYHYVLSTERYSAQLLEEVSLTVDVRSSELGAGLANVYSPSHPLTVEWIDTNHARAEWRAYDVRPNEDFELFFAPVQGGFGGGLLTGRRGDRGDHFLFLFAPEPRRTRGDSLPKDILFVMDRSGSMSGEKIEQARNALHFILGQLGEEDRFSIVGFDDHLMTFSHTLQLVNQDVLADARRFVDSLTAGGSTDLDAALQTGLEIMANSEHRQAARIVVFLTDGLPTAGITEDYIIAHRAAQTNAQIESRIHVFGVGYDVNTHLLDRVAANNGGTVTYVQPGENLESILSEFYRHIAHPVLTDVEIEFEGIRVGEMYPTTAPDLFYGSSLLLAGRYRPTSDTVTVRVRGRAGDEEREYVYHFDLRQSGDHDFVPRLWATRRVGVLLDQVRVEGQNTALVDEIRELGLDYGIVTPYTTFAIAGQVDGVASAANMALYEDQAGLNLASGRTTVQARVQNYAYQQTDQANLAVGANTVNYGQHSLAQVFSTGQDDTSLNIDLSLLRGWGNIDQALTVEWIDRNVGIDRNVTFGSEEYFALAGDAAIRPLLQSGPNVVFAHQGKVILVREVEGAVTGATRPGSNDENDAERQDGDDVAIQALGRPVNTAATPPESHTPASTQQAMTIIGILAVVAILLKTWQTIGRRAQMPAD